LKWPPLRESELIPASFDESTGCLSRPPGMTADQCDPLAVAHVLIDGTTPAVVSCWKVTADELQELVRTGRVWLFVVGQTMPPVMLSATKPFS
jgi:hypothetical protein